MNVVGCNIDFEKLKCDVTKEDQILDMFAKIKEKLGGVDVCINNAGLAHNASLLTGKTEDWRNMLEVNVLGPSICTRETVTSIQERGMNDGLIVLLCSMTGHTVEKSPPPHMYSATKFAVRALTEGLRNELVERKSHILVTAISPGWTKTKFQRCMYKDNPEIFEKFYKETTAPNTDDTVDSIIYALSAPSHVQVYDILIRAPGP